MKKIDLKVLLICIAVLLVAAAIILATIFVPRIGQKNTMREMLEKVLSDRVSVMSVFDPLYDNPNALLGDGKEVVLEDAARSALCEGLAALAEGGYRTKGSETSVTAAWNIRLAARTDEGTVYLYFTEDAFYYMEEGVACFFEAKDGAQYREFYLALTGALANG